VSAARAESEIIDPDLPPGRSPFDGTKNIEDQAGLELSAKRGKNVVSRIQTLKPNSLNFPARIFQSRAGDPEARTRDRKIHQADPCFKRNLFTKGRLANGKTNAAVFPSAREVGH